jgi:hypothetical protein
MNGFTIHQDFYEEIERLSDAEQALLFKSLLRENDPEDNVAISILYRLILNQNKRFADKQAFNGRKGGAPIGNTNASKQPKQPKQPSVTVPVTVTVPVSEREREDNSKCSYIPNSSSFSAENDGRVDEKPPGFAVDKSDPETERDESLAVKTAAGTGREKPVDRSTTLFDDFWIAYPRKIGKQDARKAWEKINPGAALVSAMLTTIEEFKHSDQWLRDKGQFIPHPATWLRQGRWDDELPVADNLTVAQRSILNWLEEKEKVVSERGS